MISNFVFKIQSSLKHSVLSMHWRVPLCGGLIGRSDECSWVLNDTSRVISRQHARVEIEREQCFWTDLGTNSTLVNGKPMLNSQRIPVSLGDVLKLGDYSIVLEQLPSNWADLDALKSDDIDDSLASFFSQPKAVINIDDLLADSTPSSSVNLQNSSDNRPVLAHRMYVGLQQANPLAPSADTSAFDLASQEKELAELRQLLRICVQGVMQMLHARRLFNTELGGELTTLSNKGNNPLKFARSVDEAWSLLTGVQSPGYLLAEPAFEQAFQDVLAHMQLGISQVQSVIDQVQGTLDPQTISSELQQASVINSAVNLAGFNLANFSPGFTATRKARLWDLYCERYKLLSDSWS